MEYITPLSSRYASREMSRLFSEEYRAICFRKLWLALAKAQKAVGANITASQIAEMKSHLLQIHLKAIRAHEEKCKHDVMAHIRAFADQCPKASSIIHLGATSCYATDNADLIIYKEALSLLLQKLAHVLKVLASFATKYAKMPCLGYTHFQSAQPTTVGKRATLWLQDLLHDALEWERLLATLPFLGAKGATGTQSSFFLLFNGNHSKVEKMEQLIAKEFGFFHVLPIAGQTYTRKIDMTLMNGCASFASSVHKMATDLRLLAHEGEICESFGKHQVGSSAMPHKRNPIYAERICGLARFVISLSQNGAYTAATQWLERSLDDSSNRRIVMPEVFLATDAILNTLFHLVKHLEVSPQTIRAHLEKELPHLAMENILIALVKKGGNRQENHEMLRQIAARVQTLDSLFKEAKKAFGLEKKDLRPLLKTENLIGRAPQQVLSFIKEGVMPFLKRYYKTGKKAVPFAPVSL